MAASSKSNQSSFITGLSMSATNRWAGMIEQTMYKKMRNSLIQLNSYIYQECPSMFAMHRIVSVFRLLQFIGPSFFVAYSNLWKSGTTDERVINLISVFFHIFPASIRDSGTIIFLSCYICLLGVFYIFTLGSAFYYKQHAMLPDCIPTTLYVMLNTVGYLIHPIAFELCGECIGLLITKTNKNPVSIDVALIVLSIVAFFIYLWLMGTIASTSILFNPCSLASTLGKPQMLLIYCTNLVTFILGIGAKLTNEIAIYVLIIIAAVLYLASVFIPFIDGGFIRFVDSCLVLMCSISGTILCIGGLVLLILNTSANMIVIFCMAAIIFLSYLLAYVIMSWRRNRALNILDAVYSDKEEFYLIRNTRQFSEYVMHGFSVAHPICISWEIFEKAIEEWPHNVKIWCFYTKFIAIYPEETQKLGWIQHQMMSLHLKGATSKGIQEEIIMLIRTRESNISPELKKKLNKISKKVQTVKHKLRHIWDLIIQGNIGDLGTFIDKAYTSIQSTQAEYNHIIRQYPNSRFVTRSYARFLIEVLADHEEFQVWAEKSKMLHRGILVTQDHAHKLGLTYFPNLPETVDKMGDLTSGQGNIDSESNFLEMDDSEDRSQQFLEQTIALKKQINDLRIPGIYFTKIHRILIPFILFLIILIVVTVLIFTLEKQYSEPLTYLQHLSMLRTHVFLTSSYGIHYIHQTLGLIKERGEIFTDQDEDTPPEHIYNTWDLQLQFSFLVNELIDSVQQLSGLRAIAQDNEHMDLAREHVFGNSVNYTQYPDPEHPSSQITSAQVGVMDTAMQLSNLFNTEIDTTVYESSMIVNPTYNANNVADSVSISLENIDQYMLDNNNSMNNLFSILRIVFLVLYPVILIALIVFEIKSIQDNKFLIFKCLTTLPKNVVSAVADSLKIIKGEKSEGNSSHEFDTELNKQEENMLKIFATASDSSSSSVNESLIMIICTVISIVLAVFFILQIHDLFTNMSLSVYQAGPHINNLMGAYAYQSSMLMILSLISSENANYQIHGSNSADLVIQISDVLESSLTYFHDARFGTEDGSEQPFHEFHDGILRQNSLRASSGNSDELPKTMKDAYESISLEILFYVIEPLIDTLIQPMSQKQQTFLPDNDLMYNLWEISTTFMYNNFFYPIFSGIIDSVETSLTSDITNTLIICYVIFILELLVEIVVIYNCYHQEQRMRFALRLLLHCNMSSFMQIPLITNVLGGNFTVQKGDTALRNKEFFDEVLDLLPDSLIIVDESGQISSVNQQAKQTFANIRSNLVGMKMDEFFNSPMFENTVNKVIHMAPPQQEEIQFVDSQTNTRFNFDIRSLSFNQILAFTIRDITQTVRYNTLIEEERLKSDKLLESILPAKLVKRVQQGEKNISFAVQSASIAFMDIVSFTPWCGSLPANRIVEILNMLYKEFDALVSKYPTATKIKCIGDCYMAASGIFSEINQPAVHAKELTGFGIDAIAAVQKVNSETDQKLQIRVGINTGGPIVAGVLGSGKPTFEILGPAINMAQQMEHSGVPMHVHISRAVYELIYGGEFKIKERGQTEIKNGPVITYLVYPN